MRDEFSLEVLKDRIDSKNTARYFEEVYSCYVHGNYRSATVMLWSVVVLDIVQKLQTLDSMYHDKKAIKILEAMHNQKKQSEKSSAWELKLIERVCKETDIIDLSDYTNLEHLQKQRHLSAHPIIKSDDELYGANIEIYTPNKDTTRALIRNALEIVLIKPPIYTQKVLDNIRDDLASHGHLFEDLDVLNNFLENKYFKRMNAETKIKVFRTFWRFVILLDNEDCKKNRIVNTKLLVVLAKNNLQLIENAVEDEKDFYSRTRSDKDASLSPIIIFLSRVPSIYKLLNLDTMLLIKQAAEKNLELNVISYFKAESLQDHYKHLKTQFDSTYYMQRIGYNAWKRLKEVSDSEEMEREFTRILSWYYSKSPSYDMADGACSNIIRFLNVYNIDDFKYLLEASEGNSQTYDRARAVDDYQNIRERVLELDKDFDFSPYPDFNGALI